MDGQPNQFHITVAGYDMSCIGEGLPLLVNNYIREAKLCDQHDLDSAGGTVCYIGIRRSDQAWPELVVIQRYSPSGYGFCPGALIVPETNVVFIGAGERLLAYDLTEPKRLWEDTTFVGFLHWHLEKDVVLMFGEIEFIAWDTRGAKLWNIGISPPCDYSVTNELLTVRDCDGKRTFPLRTGPSK